MIRYGAGLTEETEDDPMIPERLQALRAEMKDRGLDAYVVPTADFHQSEYVGEHFKARKFITGFTGSAGTAVITMDAAGLWTDGRYFLQAARQLEGTTVELFRMGEEGVPTVNEYLRSVLGEGAKIGMDGRVISGAQGRAFQRIAAEKHGALCPGEDLIDPIWTNRPKLSAEPVRALELRYSGKSTADKLADVRKAMADAGATLHLLTSLYDIAWLLNVRGNDISYVPVVLSYLAVTAEKCLWFVQEQVVDDALRAYLNENHIETRPYDSFYDYVAAIPAGETVLADTTVVNCRACSLIPAGVKVIDRVNPTVLMRAIKNDTEVANTREAHLKDAVAMCKFIYWLKKNVGKMKITEVSAGKYLAGLRAAQENFLDLSFETICAYGQHGAIVHYAATEETDVELLPEGMLLVDSGGHYKEGTTDITRTIVLGPVTDEMKADFTRVCRANMNLANVKFLHGCTGMNLDILARAPLWEVYEDFKHGTGHGVGHLLNVHEGPNGFRWRKTPDRSEGSVLEEGMITTDEPGVYIAGEYGIRTENELLCCKGPKNEFGQFMYFENLTYVPIDLDALDPAQMNETDRRLLNEFHDRVYKTMAPRLTAEEAAWLRDATRPI